MINMVYLAYVVVIFAVVKRIKASVATSKVTFGFFLGGGRGRESGYGSLLPKCKKRSVGFEPTTTLA